MQTPRNRQEFLSMQQQAAAAARDMQRRATLPMPPHRGQESARRQEPLRSQYRQPEPLHHSSPTQQARQAASYGRMQPQLRRQEWQTPPERQKDRRQEQGRSQFQQQQPRRREQPQYNGYAQYQEDPRFREPPPPPPPAAGTMPPLADLLGMLGGMGGLGGLGGLGGAAPKQESPESEFGAFEPNEAQGGMDSIMMLLLVFLLQKENADQGLLLALMYIMM